MRDETMFHPPWWVFLIFLILAAIGAATVGFGLLQQPERTRANVLLASTYLIGLSAGGLVLLALLYVSGAHWSVPLQRLPEALAIALPVGGIGLLLVVFFRPSLYAWTAHEAGRQGAASPLRSFWLDRPFFLMRALAYLAIWMMFALLIVRNSRLQDHTEDPAPTRRNAALSAGFLVVFGLTCWLSGYDWLMSLEPEWTSTIFGVYHFAGLFLSALAAVALLAVCFRRAGAMRGLVTEDRLHDLGTLLFGFSCFWAYIWFCQYLLIWYTNHPEETAWFRRRSVGAWPTLLLVDLALNWCIPFVVLLFRDAKRTPVILATVALVVLAGRWVDLFVIIFPSQGEALAIPGWIEAGVMTGAAAVFGLVLLRALAGASLVPVRESEMLATLKHKPAGVVQ
jgi:hypothetical protein